MNRYSFTLILLLFCFSLFAQVGVGTTTPNNSAALDVFSESKGFLLPRMTEVQMNAITTPIEGLLVYCIDCIPIGMYYYDKLNFITVLDNKPSGLPSDDVYSSTGRIWKSKNLGATQVATSTNDSDAVGDFYQWGRNKDGHEKVNSSRFVGPVVGGTEGANFITNTTDWLSTPTDNLWNDGTESNPIKTSNDPCPLGYRIPTKTEFLNEIKFLSSKNVIGAFDNDLKITATPYINNNGALTTAYGATNIWVSTPGSSGTAFAAYFGATSGANVIKRPRGRGLSVRCIKEI